MSFGLDRNRRRIHKLRNLAQSAIPILGIGLLMSLCAYLIIGSMGIFWALLAAPALLLYRPIPSPQALMRMHHAVPLDRSEGEGIHAVLGILSERARLPAPELYFIPSPALNAFAVGKPQEASIAITRGMLERLNIRELAGVLAHEMSHIRNNDLWIMGFAHSMGRLTHLLSYLAVLLILLKAPATETVGAFEPWALALLLYSVPAVGALLQLALSRAREYDADLEAAKLTGDPAVLASALQKLERYQGQAWESPLPSRRSLLDPRLLRSHPRTEERVRRLQQLGDSERSAEWIPAQAALKRIPETKPQTAPGTEGANAFGIRPQGAGAPSRNSL